jgi:hypothetical protein
MVARCTEAASRLDPRAAVRQQAALSSGSTEGTDLDFERLGVCFGGWQIQAEAKAGRAGVGQGQCGQRRADLRAALHEDLDRARRLGHAVELNQDVGARLTGGERQAADEQGRRKP